MREKFRLSAKAPAGQHGAVSARLPREIRPGSLLLAALRP